jgi:GNAT superfamily N-acetyltransferase
VITQPSEAFATPGWTVAPSSPGHPDAVAVLRLYLAELVSRYLGRPATEHEVDGYLADGHGSDDLAAPTGLLLVARHRGVTVGCVGLRRLGPQITELTRMFVHPDARGRGVASGLLACAEQAARELGATTMRLDTRHDLVEARRLYTRHDYREIPPYNDNAYADHWFEKHLA